MSSSVIRALRLAAPPLARQRSYNVVAIPARQKLSTAEKLLFGSVMLASWTTIPIWVMVHIREYNGKA